MGVIASEVGICERSTMDNKIVSSYSDFVCEHRAKSARVLATPAKVLFNGRYNVSRVALNKSVRSRKFIFNFE